MKSREYLEVFRDNGADAMCRIMIIDLQTMLGQKRTKTEKGVVTIFKEVRHKFDIFCKQNPSIPASLFNAVCITLGEATFKFCVLHGLADLEGIVDGDIVRSGDTNVTGSDSQDQGISSGVHDAVGAGN